MRYRLHVLVITALFTSWGINIAQAQAVRPEQQLSPAAAENLLKERKNAGTLGLAAGQLGGAYPTLAEQIAKVVDDGDNLRVIPMLTRGSIGNVEDLLYLRNVDVALTKSESLDYFRDVRHINLKERVRYITRLYDSELHILARPEITRVEDLKGKKVNIGLPGNASDTTVPIVLKSLGINAEILRLDYPVGLEMMRKGEVAATMRVVGKPGDTFTKAPTDAGFHFVSIPVPQYAQYFADRYVMGKLTNKDYPKLIAEGETITTVAVPELLAIYNWPKGTDRYQRLDKFIVSFFKNFNKLRDGPFHEKWKDVNLAATVPGWTRSEIADRMLKEMNASSTASIEQTAAPQSGNAPKDREALFREFLEWQKKTGR
jgi:uncharacterized protein